MKYITSGIVLTTLAALAFTSQVKAIELNFVNGDTRLDGAYRVQGFSQDGNGSLEYYTGVGTDAGQRKVSVIFANQNLSLALGTLGAITELSFQYYVDGATLSTGSTLAPALRLKTSPIGTGSDTYVDLVWEPVYNGPVVQNAWVSADVVNGLFWQRSNGANHDGDPDFQTLTTFVAGHQPTFNGNGVALNANTPIYGIEISLGSGLPQNFHAFIDNARISFGGSAPTTYQSATAVPEPGTASLLSLAAVGLLGLRRRRA